MSPAKDPKTFHILVHGDVVIDHHIYRGDCEHPRKDGCGTRIVRDQGGAGQTARLLREMCRAEPRLAIHDATPPLSDQLPLSPGVHHAYATWTTYAPSKDPARKGEPKVWRVSETFGFGSVEATAPTGLREMESPTPADCDVLVIDEGGLGFRSNKTEWPAAIDKNRASDLPWIVLKMSSPVCMGDLWTRLSQAPFLDRLVVLVAADDLRRSGAAVSKGLSWEKSVRELLGDFAFHSEFREIAQARHIVVNFGHDGALWIDNTDRGRPKRQLIFDPGHLEGDWQEDLDGTVLGAGSCLLAYIVRSLFDMNKVKGAKPDKDGNVEKILDMTDGRDLGAGITRGLAARRTLLLSGHGTTEAQQPGFPYEAICSVQQAPRSGGFSTVQVPDFAVPVQAGFAENDHTTWSIIAGNSVANNRPLFGKAIKVAREGEAALKNIPYGRFNDLYTVDCLELKGYYGLQKLMKDYRHDAKADTPLCLGVFGPPGSGKSFGIKQIARGILGSKVPILTFNLSQFTSKEMLVGAFHQVRDEVLRGELPIVFWDEFDCDQLSWLQFMLAPMNDGEFLEGQVTHPIGKCIFVFAGGTCDSLEEFAAIEETGDGKRTFKEVKGPDFVSRLKGYLNVLGPNPRKVDGTRDTNDVGYPIRRAIMLRVLAKKFGSKPLQIDPGLLNAMLKIGEFKHGARSMATIINLTTGGNSRGLLRSNLPPREQLGLHVKADEFMALVQEGGMFKLKAEEFAPVIHQFYLDLAKTEQWDPPPKYPMGWNDKNPELPEDIKKDNVAAARRLPEVLSLVGLTVVEAKDTSDDHDPLAGQIIKENLELLAEAEHNGWMAFKKDNDWTWADLRNDDEKQHPAMVPYKDLPEVDKGKDRDAVKNYLKIVPLAGYTIQLEPGAGEH